MRIGTFIGMVGLSMLTACGGDSNDAGRTVDAVMTLSGTAATGKAVSTATVEARCTGGSGMATTNTDGSYSMTVAGRFPCILRVSVPGSEEKLHSLAFGNGNSARANITPLTELLVARLVHGSPAAFFTAFDPASASALNSENQVMNAQTDVTVALSSIGDIASVGRFITDTLKAATPTTASDDPQDKLLDLLKSKLSGSGFSDVRTALASGVSTPEIAHLVARLANTTVTEVPVAFDEIVWNTYLFSGEQTMVVNDAATWASVQAQYTRPGLEPASAAIDFSRQTVIGIVSRIVLSGQIIRIVRAYSIGGKLFIEYGITNHTSYPITSYRALFAAIPKTTNPVEFVQVQIPWSPV